jgi:hypothetical protein
MPVARTTEMTTRISLDTIGSDAADVHHQTDERAKEGGGQNHAPGTK